MLDNLATTTTINTGEDRFAQTTISLRVYGYLIPDSINKKLANSSITYSPSKVVFTFETTSDIIALEDPNISNSTPTTAMGSFTPVDSYNVNVTNVTSVDATTLIYLITNKPLVASSVTTDTATFNGSFLAAPAPLPATSAASFNFFINGQYIDTTAIISFVDNGDGTCTLTVDTNILDYTLESVDEITAIGKFQ